MLGGDEGGEPVIIKSGVAIAGGRAISGGGEAAARDVVLPVSVMRRMPEAASSVAISGVDRPRSNATDRGVGDERADVVESVKDEGDKIRDAI